MSEEEENKNNVNEPQAEYLPQQKTGYMYNAVTISSFEEMREDNYRHWLSITPEQRLAEHYVRITTMYKDEIAQTKGLLYDKIYFHE